MCFLSKQRKSYARVDAKHTINFKRPYVILQCWRVSLLFTSFRSILIYKYKSCSLTTLKNFLFERFTSLAWSNYWSVKKINLSTFIHCLKLAQSYLKNPFIIEHASHLRTSWGVMLQGYSNLHMLNGNKLHCHFQTFFSFSFFLSFFLFFFFFFLFCSFLLFSKRFKAKLFKVPKK